MSTDSDPPVKTRLTKEDSIASNLITDSEIKKEGINFDDIGLVTINIFKCLRQFITHH